jgi:hypothetical protein
MLSFFVFILFWAVVGYAAAYCIETANPDVAPVTWPAHKRIPYAVMVAPALLFFVVFAYIDDGFKWNHSYMEGTAAWYYDTLLELFRGGRAE